MTLPSMCSTLDRHSAQKPLPDSRHEPVVSPPAPPEHKHRPLVMSDTVPSDNRRTQCLTLTDRLPEYLTAAAAVLRVFSRLVSSTRRYSRDDLILLNMHAIIL